MIQGTVPKCFQMDTRETAEEGWEMEMAMQQKNMESFPYLSYTTYVISLQCCIYTMGTKCVHLSAGQKWVKPK